MSEEVEGSEDYENKEASFTTDSRLEMVKIVVFMEASMRVSVTQNRRSCGETL